jgi:hypothetical protein
LNELRMEWSSGQSQGTATADVAPRSKGMIEIPLPERAASNAELTLRFFNRGELVDAYVLPMGSGNPVHADAAAATPSGSETRLEQGEKSIVVRAEDCYWEFDRKTGLLVAGGKSRSAALVVGGPYLAITPLELAPFSQISGPNLTLQPPVMNWVASSVQAQVEDGSVVICTSGSYPDYSGGYTDRIDGSGRLTVDYRFEFIGGEARPREIGLLFDIPANVNILRWKHKTQWSYYPEGHIGRPEGTAVAFRDASAWPPAIWGEAPPWPWELDSTAEGTNDFRSSKFNILWAALTNAQGQGLRVDSDGRQTVRAWVDRDRVRFLVSDFANGGSEVFLRDTHWSHEQRTLRKGDVVSGTVRLTLTGEMR